MHPQHPRRPFWFLTRRRETVAADVEQELAVHIEMRTEELVARGVAPEEARRQAMRQFGDLDYTRQYCQQQDLEKERRMSRGLTIADWLQELRVCVRGLRRSAMTTATIVATVGLGIGATTVIFSAVYAALLRPLPYDDPGRLVRIYTDSPPNRFRFSVADYLALDAQQTQFARVAGYTDRALAFSDGSVAERVRGREVTWTYFSLLGIRPARGRDFSETDGRPGSPRTVLLSDGFWQRRLGGRADVAGRAIRLDGLDYTIAGVLPREMGPLEMGQELFVVAQWQTPPRKGPFFVTAIGRLRDTASAAVAAEELRAINKRLFPVWATSYQDEKATWGLLDLQTHVTGDVRTTAGLALGAVGLVWLIACANASNLLIARVASRRRELAVRTALGASRGRVVQYLLLESGVLAVAAALVGVALAMVGVRLLRDVGAAFFPRTQEIALDGPVLWLLIALTLASVVLFGLVPALHGGGGSVDEALRSMGRSSTGNAAVRRLRRVLVGSQFAIATPLLVAAGLLLASLQALGRVDLGFDSRNLVGGSILLPAAKYADAAPIRIFWDELERRVEALPGVTAVAFADGRPPNDVGSFNNFDLEEQPTPPGQSQPLAAWLSVTPKYFALLGLTLVDGRLFDERDGLDPDVDVVIVDRAWQRRFFPNESAIGKRMRNGGCTTCPWTTVIGVVSDVKYAGLDQPNDGSVYAPMRGRGTTNPIPQLTSRFAYVLLRTAGDASAMMPAVARVLRDLDPELPLSNVATIDELVARALQRPRSLSLLVGAFALVALVLSVVGIYGVMAYYVQQHAKDISIRMALGGSAGNVLRMVLGQGMLVVGAGLLVGLGIAWLLTGLMTRALFGVSAGDGMTFAAVGVLLSSVAFVACLVPAKRAVGLQPAVVLRND